MTKYADFLAGKDRVFRGVGFDPPELNPQLFDFQRDIVRWALRKGRAAIFADCGLGKTPMQLEWAYRVAEETGRPVLILTPLAVSAQTVGEAIKFGYDAAKTREGAQVSTQIWVTNYQQLHYLDPSRFAGVVCDESSILKNFDGTTRTAITEFMKGMKYRLLCTATASPNDYIELGTSSEALGELGYMDMLGMFFKNDNDSIAKRGWGEQSKWRFKRHAQEPFWKWVSSWAIALRKPSDLGYPDNGFTLPPLIERETVITATKPRDGLLFDLPAVTLAEQREELRRTIDDRCAMAAEIINTHDEPCVAWCHLNAEGDALTAMIPGAEQVSGADSDETKEARFEAFSRGDIRVLVTKPKIGGFGLNWQHCARQTFFPSHSFEQYYQATRRSWRFGQTRPVEVDVIASTAQTGVLKNLKRKARQASDMFDALLRHMNDATQIVHEHGHDTKEEVPEWLSATK